MFVVTAEAVKYSPVFHPPAVARIATYQLYLSPAFATALPRAPTGDKGFAEFPQLPKMSYALPQVTAPPSPNYNMLSS